MVFYSSVITTMHGPINIRISEHLPSDTIHHLLTVTTRFTYVRVHTVFHAVQLRIANTLR